ncbi:hypothetical protein ABZ949_33290 [Micromonospora tulbaghiae]|uniref:hypothetical protein n=1 Tax=Micromonospora tulbaghiae TaxID=479978 RepID=UPI0033DB7798
MRCTVEEAFQAAKSQVRLNQRQVPRWGSWHRFASLALAALAICAPDAGRHDPADTGPIKLVDEGCRLINTCIIRPISDLAHRLHWSQWRGRHQARARRSHLRARRNLVASRCSSSLQMASDGLMTTWLQTWTSRD